MAKTVQRDTDNRNEAAHSCVELSDINEYFLAQILAQNKLHPLVNHYPTSTTIAYSHIPLPKFSGLTQERIEAYVAQATSDMALTYKNSISREITFTYSVKHSDMINSNALFVDIELVKALIRSKFSSEDKLMEWANQYLAHRFYRAVTLPAPEITKKIENIKPPEMIYSVFKQIFG